MASISGLTAQAQNASSAVNAMPGNTDTGRQIATSGAPGAAACASCHGAQGEGMAASNFPRIAGQPQAYLARQLTLYANGTRNNPIMTPIAKGLTPQQMEAVSAYYAALVAPAPKPPTKAAAQALKRGLILANTGDEKIGVQACANCHGPGGVGQPPNYPSLASQHGGYLVATLNDWKSGARKTDPSQQMNVISQRLSTTDMTALAAYYATQPAPPPATQRVNIPAGSAARPAAPGTGAGAQADTPPVKGIGSEQGAATSGGNQGPGGGGSASGSGPSGSK
jgi:cytochrome c553